MVPVRRLQELSEVVEHDGRVSYPGGQILSLKKYEE
jgi:hypothetical protein